MTWDEGSATCLHVLAGMRLEILTAGVGPERAPQERIQFARLVYVYSDWHHPLAGLASESSPAAAVPFPVSMYVRFLRQAQTAANAVRSLPPLRASFPQDLFYPFTTSRAARARGAPVVSAALTAFAAGCLLLLAPTV